MKIHLLLPFLLWAAPAQADDRVVVAVADFEVTSNSAALAPLGKGLAQMLITDLSVSKSIRIVERARLRALFSEINLQRSPYFDTSSAAKLGKGLGAELVVTGQLAGQGEQLRLDVRAIDVETSEVLAASKVEGKKSAIFELQRELASSVLKKLGAELSPIARKRIGKRGTRSVDALMSFGAALDAEDRGAKAELSKHLAAALAADPSFSEAQRRLDALETRVQTLERSGGLIIKPTGWRDHLHNFRVHRENANLLAAEKSLAAALALESRRAELWAGYHDLPKKVRSGAVARARLEGAAKKALTAHLSEDLGALRDAPASKEHPAFRAVLVVDFVGRRMSAPTFTALLIVSDALDYVLSPKNRRRVEPMLVDAEAFFSLARKLKQEHLEGKEPPTALGDGWMAAPADAFASSSAWEVRVVLPERPASPVEISFDRVPLPRGDKPYPNAGLWETERSKKMDETKRRALLSGKAYGWYVHGSDDPFSRRGVSGHASWGKSFEVPNEDGYVRCRQVSKSPTGKLCLSTVTIKKLSVPPGAYRAKLAYTDAAGTRVKWENPRFWFFEHNLREFRTGLWKNMDPRFLVNPIDDKVRARIDPEALKKDRYAMVARACANPPLSRAAPSPLVSIHYDADFALNRGKPMSGASPAKWRAYRTKILKRGHHAKPHGRSDGCAYIPLPALKPGEHELCLVAQRKGGSKTLEPECFTVEVPERYPQEGRTRKKRRR